MNNEYASITPKAGKMREVMRSMIEKPEYQRGFDHWDDETPKTYCNICGVATGKLLGFNMRSFYRNHDEANEMRSPLAEIYQQLIDDGIKQVDAKTAQSLANIGCFVIGWSAKYDHVVMVCPDTEDYNAKRGPLIIQAGWWNTEVYISDPKSFGNYWRDPEIKYFVPEEAKKDGE
jgi:hypothetical protein